MLWNAVQDYSGRKRIQRRNEQENKKGEEEEVRVRDCTEVSLLVCIAKILFVLVFPTLK